MPIERSGIVNSVWEQLQQERETKIARDRERERRRKTERERETKKGNESSGVQTAVTRIAINLLSRCDDSCLYSQRYITRYIINICITKSRMYNGNIV